MIWQRGAHCSMLSRYGSHISTHAAWIPRRCLALSSAWKNPSRLSFFRSCPNHKEFAGLQVAHYAEKLLSLSQIDFILPHLAQCWLPPRSIPALQIPQINRSYRARRQPELAPHLPGRSHFTGQSYRVFKPPGKGGFARQQWHLLAFDSAIRTPHPIDLDEHRCHKSTPWKIADCPFADVIELGELPATPTTLDSPIPPFASNPQLQSLGLFVNLMLIDPVPWPI